MKNCKKFIQLTMNLVLSTRFLSCRQGAVSGQKVVNLLFFLNIYVDKSCDTALALLGFLSDNYSKCAYFNTVFPSQKEMDRVGFEPTTAASFL
jgi:hypothetical protein